MKRRPFFMKLVPVVKKKAKKKKHLTDLAYALTLCLYFINFRVIWELVASII